MREIRDLLRVLGAVGESPRPIRRSAQFRRNWQQELEEIVELISEYWSPDAILVEEEVNYNNGVLTPSLRSGETYVSLDVYEFWVDEGCPSLYKKDQRDLEVDLGNDVESLTNSTELADKVYENLSEFSPDEFAAVMSAAATELGVTVPDTVVWKDRFEAVLRASDGWYWHIDWQGDYPKDRLVEEYLNEDPCNWMVADDYLINVGEGFTSYGRPGVPDWNRFRDLTQELIDEAAEEENEIEEFDYSYDTEYVYRNPLFDEFTAQLEGQDVLAPDVARKLIASLPKYVQSQLSRLIEEQIQRKQPITSQFLTSELNKFNLNFTVDRGDERYLGQTMSGSPFTFCFDRTDELDSAVKKIGQAAQYVWDRSKWGHYDQAVAYVRIDGNLAPIQTGDDKQLPGYGWVIENIQSDPMRSITDYMGSAGSEKRKSLTEILQISKSEVERQINRLSNYLSDWPFALAAYLEQTAEQNDVAYLVWTDSDFQMERWGGLNEGSAKYYYDKIPELLGYQHYDRLRVFGERISAWIKKVGSDATPEAGVSDEVENAQP